MPDTPSRLRRRPDGGRGTALRGGASARGFSLIEVLIAIAVIAVLVGLLLAALPMVQRSQRIKATRMLVDSVALAITTYDSQWFTVTTRSAAASGSGFDYRTARHRLWDWNGDTILDGDPASEPADAALRQAAVDARYRGFLDSALATIPAKHVDASSRRVIDAWRRPLRIAFSSQVGEAVSLYGGVPFGIWSLGPNPGLGDADDAYDTEAARVHRDDAAWLKTHPSADNIVSWGQ